MIWFFRLFSSVSLANGLSIPFTSEKSAPNFLKFSYFYIFVFFFYNFIIDLGFVLFLFF